jgi:hypothetical protein
MPSYYANFAGAWRTSGTLVRSDQQYVRKLVRIDKNKSARPLGYFDHAALLHDLETIVARGEGRTVLAWEHLTFGERIARRGMLGAVMFPLVCIPVLLVSLLLHHPVPVSLKPSEKRAMHRGLKAETEKFRRENPRNMMWRVLVFATCTCFWWILGVRAFVTVGVLFWVGALVRMISTWGAKKVLSNFRSHVGTALRAPCSRDVTGVLLKVIVATCTAAEVASQLQLQL